LIRGSTSEGRLVNCSSLLVGLTKGLLTHAERHYAAHDRQDDKDHSTNDGDNKVSSVRLCHVINMLDRSGHRERCSVGLGQFEKETVEEQIRNLGAGQSVTNGPLTSACRKTGEVVPASEESLWVVGDYADVG